MLPFHLAQLEPQQIAKNEPIAQFEIGNYKNFIYLILDWAHKKAVVVDPQTDIHAWLLPLKEYGFTLTGVLLTHTHFDHIAGVPALAKLDPKLPIYAHSADQHRLPRGLSQMQSIEDGQILSLGELKIRVLHTPGHSAGECSYFVETPQPYLFTGDTVFIRDCGRTDLESGSDEQMFESLNRIKALPKDTIILPGHHYAKECASTLALELKTSPCFLAKSVIELRALP